MVGIFTFLLFAFEHFWSRVNAGQQEQTDDQDQHQSPDAPDGCLLDAQNGVGEGN